jgi:hypothetical protein
MAPELYEISQDDEGHYGPDPTEKIDVFWFRLILYEIVVGKPVFSFVVDPVQVMLRVLNRTRAPIPGCIPAFVFQLISNC